MGGHKGDAALKVAIYTRVSTDIQAEEGFSLSAQLDRLRLYCESQDWEVHSVYTDEGISAKNMDRPALRRLIDDAKSKQIDVVLVYKLDRLTRNLIDLNELLQTFDKYGVSFKSATESYDTTTAMGRLLINIVGSLAQWERENLAERTKMGQVEMTRQGRWSGGRPAFGYRYEDGQLIVDEKQAEIVREMFERYNRGEGVRKLLQWLNNPSDPKDSPRGRWTLNAVKYVLRNPLYAGMLRYGYRDPSGKRKEEFIVAEGNHEAVITLDDWRTANEIREKRKTNPSRSGTGTYAFTGIARCGLCGSAMSGLTTYKKNKNESPARRYYICGEKAHSGLCELPRIREEVIENQVLAAIMRQRQLLLSLPTEERKAKNNFDVSKKRSELEKRRQKWFEAYDAEIITLDQFQERLHQIKEDENELNKIEMESDIDEESVRKRRLLVMKNIESSWDRLQASEKRSMVKSIVEEIRISKGPSVSVLFK